MAAGVCGGNVLASLAGSGSLLLVSLIGAILALLVVWSGIGFGLV